MIKNSYLKRINPILKIIPFIAIVVLIFFKTDFLIQIVIMGISFILYFLAFIPLKGLRRMLVSYCAIFLFLLLINWLSQKDPLVYTSEQINSLRKANSIFGNVQKIDVPVFDSKMSKLPTDVQYVWTGGFASGGFVPNISNANPNLGLISTNAKGLEAWIKNNVDYKSIGYTIDNLRSADIYLNNNVKWTFFYFTKFYGLTNIALVSSVYVANKLLIVILLSTVFTTTTSTIELTYALEDLLKPLSIFRLPVRELAMILSIAIRFVPSLIAETLRIMQAQASRGIDFKNGKLFDKITSLTSLIIPLFTIAFLKADDLANAMTARSYNPRYARSRYRTFSLHAVETLGFGLLIILVALFYYFSFKSVIVADFGILNALIVLGK